MIVSLTRGFLVANLIVALNQASIYSNNLFEVVVLIFQMRALMDSEPNFDKIW